MKAIIASYFVTVNVIGLCWTGRVYDLVPNFWLACHNSQAELDVGKIYGTCIQPNPTHILELKEQT